MITIKGQNFLTVHATADEIYEVDFVSSPRLDIMNNTDSDVLLGTDNNFFNSTAVGQYITLPAGTAVNDMAFPFGKVYIKAAASGDIVIVRCG